MLSSVKEQNMTSQGLYYNPLVPLYLFPAGDDFSKVQAYQRYDSERNLLTQYWPYSTSLALQNPYWITEHIKYLIIRTVIWQLHRQNMNLLTGLM